jgi:hypothetical protein
MLSGNVDYAGATDYLTEADYNSFPDLQYMYVLHTRLSPWGGAQALPGSRTSPLDLSPVSAFSINIGYSLPGITNLVLDMDILAGIWYCPVHTTPRWRSASHTSRHCLGTGEGRSASGTTLPSSSTHSATPLAFSQWGVAAVR